MSLFEGAVGGGVLTPPAGDGVAEGAIDATAALAEGLREHMGAAHVVTVVRVRTATDNMRNMLGKKQGAIEGEWGNGEG